jgi:CDP-diacylglycerol pyrophosphatase
MIIPDPEEEELLLAIERKLAHYQWQLHVPVLMLASDVLDVIRDRDRDKKYPWRCRPVDYKEKA